MTQCFFARATYADEFLWRTHYTESTRAPNLVKPEDHVCQRLAPIVYAKCGPSDVDATVEEAIQSLKASLTSVGPFLSKGIILISFFEKREVKGFFGLVSSTENIYFERWRIPVLIDERQLLSPQHVDQYDSYLNSTNGHQSNESNCDGRTDYYAQGAAETERKYLVDFALQVVQKRLVTILEVINTLLSSVLTKCIYSTTSVSISSRSFL